MDEFDLKREVTDKYSLRGRVFTKIREDILNGRYKEHEELKEIRIGNELGVSRTPVREALRQLERQAETGRRYLAGLRAETVRLGLLARKTLPGQVLRTIVDKLEVRELEALRRE